MKNIILISFQWITLEAAKHGMLHVRFTWLELTSSLDDLQAVIYTASFLLKYNKIISNALLFAGPQ